MKETWNTFINFQYFPKSFSGLPVEKVYRKITAQREKKKLRKAVKFQEVILNHSKFIQKRLTKKDNLDE